MSELAYDRLCGGIKAEEQLEMFMTKMIYVAIRYVYTDSCTYVCAYIHMYVCV